MSAPGFTRVTPTPEERADWRAAHGRRSDPPYRVQCERCGRRIWLSGLGVVSHRRACRPSPVTVPVPEVSS